MAKATISGQMSFMFAEVEGDDATVRAAMQAFVGQIPAPAVEAKTLARATHPDTSHRAAQELVDSGALAVMETVALACVEDFPDCTARELDQHHGGNGDRPIGKRLSSLEERGLIAKGAERKCSVSGKVACTWHSVVKRGSRL